MDELTRGIRWVRNRETWDAWDTVVAILKAQWREVSVDLRKDIHEVPAPSFEFISLPDCPGVGLLRSTLSGCYLSTQKILLPGT